MFLTTRLSRFSPNCSSLARRQYVSLTKDTHESLTQDHNGTFNLEKDFGKFSFNDAMMKNRLSPDVFKRYKKSLLEKTPLEPDVANSIAHALKEWALSHGATHYSHWFQPLTGWTAEKHDSFISLSGSSLNTQFKGKMLLCGETDGSSFPNGGLRPTDAARGYTIWDPQTPCFLMMEGDVPTLCIPSLFQSYYGHALDRKTPLLRSATSLDAAGKRLFSGALEEEGITEIYSDSGVEQEFFIVQKEHFRRRPDLLAAGRTLQGSNPPKTQQLADHYCAPMPSHAVQFIHQVERALWKLGIPLTTRHQEVAPNQFEWAPVFSRSSVASDQNLLAMEVTKRIAENQGLAVLLHEKPFAKINGSGKHNNWSIGNNKFGSLMDPGENPSENLSFLLSLASVLRSVDLYQDLFRWSTSGHPNDQRLGGHEAPPAIFSVYLGDYIGSIVESIIDGKPAPAAAYPPQESAIPYLPERKADDTDRNRTSPVAFTGNKFEVRCVGASQVPAFSNYVLNVTTADSFDYLAKEIEKEKKSGSSIPDAVKKVVRETFKKHFRIVHNGDGYSSAWVEEAKKRGLLNLKTTPDALDAVNNEKVQKLLERYNVLSKDEFRAHLSVDYTRYVQNVALEAGILKNLAHKYIVPVIIRYQNELLLNQESVPESLRKTIKEGLAQLVESANDLGAKEKILLETEDNVKAARYAIEHVVPAMQATRSVADKLEDCVGNQVWPLPNYEEMLLSRHVR